MHTQPPDLGLLGERLSGVMNVDRARLGNRIRGLRRGADPAQVARLADDVARAEERLALRRASVPAITYPEELPVSQRRDEIRKAIDEHQVIVLCGETGSGKTTQLPKICLELGRGVRGLIGHTQPRRIAARSVAARVAEELGSRDLVGYKVRFGDSTGPRNLIKLMTDGILLAETQNDRALLAYDTIIIDEAHERSLNIDFMLGYLRTLLPRRPDLKVIVTSATIDPERFARHFAKGGRPAPIITVSGRTFPVDTRYRPPGEEDLDERDEAFQNHIVDAVQEVCAETDGDVLVFLSGEREIRETAETLSGRKFPGPQPLHVLPLFARLGAEEQQRVFQPHDGRRIVLATNVAETSLTVPGIRAVVDPGYARINRYSPRTKVQRLEIEPVSRASADQRAGRCGRTGPGVCIRLYSEDDYKARDQFTDPEILRDNLASVILQMAALNLGKVEDFPFVERPDERAVRDGYETLLELGAVTEEGALTPLGRDLARLPIDPRLGRMILEGGREGALAEVLVIASALAIQDPRERPLALQEKADAAHEEFRDPTSDFLSVLRLWSLWKQNRRDLGGSRLRRWCKERFISFVRMREWEDMHQQLSDLADELRLRRNREPAPADRVHRCVLTGLLCNIGVKADGNDRELGPYTGQRGNRFGIFPGSTLFRNGPKWLVAAEIVRTTKVYARTVAPVQPEWIEELGAHLLKRSHSDPRWDKHAGRVIANERITILGLELVPKRRVHFGPVDPKVSREIMIHHALVLGELERRPTFLQHNLGIEDQVKALEVRTRRNNLVADAEKRFRYYDARVPHDVYTAGAFEKWRHEESKKQPRLLYMSLEDLLADGVSLPAADLYPDTLDVGPFRLPLVYRLEPGNDADGVTVRIPLDALGQVTPERLAWLVPGHVREKVETILRGLGKEWRRLLPPASALAESVMPHLKPGDGSLLDALRAAILRATTHEVPRDVLAGVPLPPWMTMRIEILDEHDAVLAAGRDLNALKALLAPRLRSGLLTSPSRFTREGITQWDFGDLPERVELERGGVRFGAFPGIADNGPTVSLRLFDTWESAQAATRAGSRRLFMLAAKEALSRYAAGVHGFDKMALSYAPLGNAAKLRGHLQELIADRAFIGDMLPVRTEKEFAFRTDRGIDRLSAAVQEVVPLASNILALYQAVGRELASASAPAFAESVNDMRDQLGDVMPPDFLVAVPYEWLRHVPRYLQAMRVRLQRIGGGGVERDRKQMAEVTPFTRGAAELKRREKELGLDPQRVEEFRWLVQEFRVQVFAQDLRTAVPVSAKRLQDAWEAIVK